MKVNIVLYGLGERYKIFIEWIRNEISDKVEIVGITDKNSHILEDYEYPFIDREKLDKVNFDKIIITSDRYFDDIFSELRDQFCIPSDKIIPMRYIIEELLKKHFRIEYFKEKDGVEIGGPSNIFEKNIYSVCSSCDGVNFNSDTVWWKQEGLLYEHDGKKLGKIIIADATCLVGIDNGKYDFCISSNNLEHIANPMKALKEFVRITKTNGYLLILVPVKDKCFDHNCEYTSFEHLLEDYNNDILEDDLTHLEEILEKHDLSMDLAAGGG